MIINVILVGEVFINNKYFEIDPKKYKQNIGYYVCLSIWYIIWLPATLGVTILLFLEPSNIFLYLWLCFGYTGVILVPYTVINRNKKYVFKISKDELMIYGTKVFKRTPIILAKDEINSLTLEAYDEESFNTINIWYRKKNAGYDNRIGFAEKINSKDKEVIFEELKTFLIEQHFIESREN